MLFWNFSLNRIHCKYKKPLIKQYLYSKKYSMSNATTWSALYTARISRITLSLPHKCRSWNINIHIMRKTFVDARPTLLRCIHTIFIIAMETQCWAGFHYGGPIKRKRSVVWTLRYFFFLSFFIFGKTDNIRFGAKLALRSVCQQKRRALLTWLCAKN